MPSPSSTSPETIGPTNLEAEQLLLGSLLSENDAYHEIAGQLAPEHFSNETHAQIYQLIGRLVGEGREATPITIMSMVGVDVRLRDYLGALLAAANEAFLTGVKHTVPGLADEIIDLAERRALIAAADEARALSRLSPGAIATDDLHSRVEGLLVRLPKFGGNAAIRTAGDLATETLAAAETIHRTGETPGFRSGFKPWDDLVGPMMPGDLIVVGGATSAGKTALVQQIAFHVAHTRRVLVMSMEMTARQWNDRYITQLTGLSAETLEVGPFDARAFELIALARDETLANLHMVICDQSGLTVPQIASQARRIEKRFGLDLLVIDHLQFILPTTPTKEGPAAVAEITAGLKGMAKTIRVPVVLVSHLNRETHKRASNRPVLADLYGGSAIEKDADTVLFVHREHYWLARKGPESEDQRLEWESQLKEIERDAELILAKRRRGRGADYRKIGFDPDRTLFYEPEESK